MLDTLRKKTSGAKGWLALLPGWGLLVLAVWLPQSCASNGSTFVGVLLGLVFTAGWVGLMVVIGWSTNRGLIGAAIGVAEIALMHAFGSGEFQSALALQQGRSLDGVTLADALARREPGIWVRLTDARVRSDANEDMHFTSGGGRDSKGGVTATRIETVSVAPVTLASEVPHEETYLRGTPSGPMPLWACATNSFVLRDWDTQRQAVRGRLAPMEDNVRASLAKEIGPSVPVIPAGAGAIPAAPGAVERTIPTEHAGMSLPANPWCVHLDLALDAAAARDQAMSTVLAIGSSVPIFVGLFAFLVARTRPETPKR